MADKDDYDMCLEENRLTSFKNWPFEDEGQEGICTAKKMAESGFYSCATDACPDLVRCYVCFKELEGWEPTDDPWAEHISHSATCAFAKKGKPQAELTLEEYIKMETASQQNRIVKEIKAKITDLEKMSQDVLDELLKLGSS